MSLWGRGKNCGRGLGGGDPEVVTVEQAVPIVEEVIRLLLEVFHDSELVLDHLFQAIDVAVRRCVTHLFHK